jgi:hypothetical protein
MKKYFMIRYQDPNDLNFPAQDLMPCSTLGEARRHVHQLKTIGDHKDMIYTIEELSYEIAI